MRSITLIQQTYSHIDVTAPQITLSCRDTQIVKSPVICTMTITEDIPNPETVSTSIFTTINAEITLFQMKETPREWSFYVDGVNVGDVVVMINGGVIMDICGNANYRSNIVTLRKSK